MQMPRNAAATVTDDDLEGPARLIEIQSEDEIPHFANEDEEAEFWSTHSFGERYLAEHPPVELDWLPPTQPRTNPVAIRFDADTLCRLKALAKKKHKGYQTLLKEFVMERLYEEEKREGIIPVAEPRTRRSAKARD